MSLPPPPKPGFSDTAGHGTPDPAVYLSEVSFNPGNTIVLFANQYPGMVRTLMEMIQNSIDAGAKRIFIGVDQMTRLAVIADNGRGADRQDMDNAFRNVAESQKDRTKIGKFGIGMFSPWTKCQRYTIASWKRGRDTTPTIWHLSPEEFKQDPRIPSELLDSMPTVSQPFTEQAEAFISTAAQKTEYRTIVTMYDITDDKIVSQVDLSELEYLVQSQLGTHLQQKGVSCRIVLRDEKGRLEQLDIKPYEFKGEYLGTFEEYDDYAGRVEITIYRARFGGKRGVFGVSEMPPKATFPVPWAKVSQHVKQLDKGYWADSEVVQAFDSRYFEGLITVENLELNEGRDGFHGNDALKGLMVALDSWYHKHGHPLYHQEHDKKIDERYADISAQAMAAVQDRILKNPAYQFLTDRIRDVVHIGSVGRGQGEPEEPLGKEPTPSTRVKSEGEGRPKDPPTQGEGPERSNDMPSLVMGRGRRRTKVKDDSVGLSIAVVDLDNPYALWETDYSTGRITFNSSHPLWAELDGSLARQKRSAKHDEQIKKLQIWVIAKELLMLEFANDPAKLQLLRDQAHEEALVMAELLLKQ